MPNAEGLTTAQMQAIANEFNLSETTFVLPPKDAAHTAEVRIFTPQYEMPFAGHPNVGTGFVVASRGSVYGRPVGKPLLFEEKAGLVPIEVLKDAGAIVGARLTAPQLLSRAGEISVDIIAAACSIAPDDIETRYHTLCTRSCGTRVHLCRGEDAAGVGAAQPRSDIFAARISRSMARPASIST